MPWKKGCYSHRSGYQQNAGDGLSVSSLKSQVVGMMIHVMTATDLFRCCRL
jgi:hypothetical protein